MKREGTVTEQAVGILYALLEGWPIAKNWTGTRQTAPGNWAMVYNHTHEFTVFI